MPKKEKIITKRVLDIPENKNLKMLNKECDKNFDSVTHGGYECGDDGKWTKNCKPFFISRVGIFC